MANRAAEDQGASTTADATQSGGENWISTKAARTDNDEAEKQNYKDRRSVPRVLRRQNRDHTPRNFPRTLRRPANNLPLPQTRTTASRAPRETREDCGGSYPFAPSNWEPL